MKDTVKIRFIVESAPKDGSGLVYKEGEEHSMSLSSAEHWVKRNKAVFVDGDPQTQKAQAPQATITDKAEQRRQEKGRPDFAEAQADFRKNSPDATGSNL